MSFEVRDGRPVIVLTEDDPRLWTETEPKMCKLNLEERTAWLKWEAECQHFSKQS